MVFETWWVWMALTAVFLIIELFSTVFFFLWFGIGAAVAAILAICDLGLGWQWIAFLIVSGALVAASRKFSWRKKNK